MGNESGFHLPETKMKIIRKFLKAYKIILSPYD